MSTFSLQQGQILQLLMVKLGSLCTLGHLSDCNCHEDRRSHSTSICCGSDKGIGMCWSMHEGSLGVKI